MLVAEKARNDYLLPEKPAQNSPYHQGRPHKKEKPWSVKMFSLIIVAALFISLGIGFTARYVEIVNSNYSLLELEKEMDGVLRENSELRVEIAELKSIERISSIAESQLGMVKPDKESVEYIWGGK